MEDKDIKIIDNFLSKEEFLFFKNNIISDTFPFFINRIVSYQTEREDSWSWYATHMIYDKDSSSSNFFEPFYNIFVKRFSDIVGFKSLLRIKINLYPHTDTLMKNEMHVDYPYDHHAAVFSLNTCDGFTGFENGFKSDSIENRIVFFNGGNNHHSTTTTNKFRYNINFNWL
jgi:hypothetical protein